jgi:phosphohistidine phosphatase
MDVDLYLVRHAEAAALGENGVTEDADRSLTSRGQEQARKLAAGLHRRGIRFGAIVTSPLLRARQTAEAMAGALPQPAPQLQTSDELAPDGKRKRLKRLLGDLATDQIALIGHQPDLGDLAAWLIGSRKAQLDIAKAGVACIHLENGVGKGKGSLAWLVTPELVGD